MFCRKCGAPNPDDASRCDRCGDVMLPLVPKKIDNNLTLAIVVTVLFCLPLGIVGIVYAAQVNALAAAGDIAGAQVAARKARLWSLWGLAVGLVVYTFWGLSVAAKFLSP